MYVDIVWWEAEDPETGLPVVKGGEYHNVCNLSFAPQTDLTGNSLPINQYTIDIITEDDIPTETVGHSLYDDRDFLWADWPITKVQRLAPNCVRVTASSWLHKLDGQMEAVMYEDEPASDAIEACFGTGSRDYSVNAAIAAKTVTGFAPAQTARERLTWLCFVLGAFVVDTFRDDARITGIDSTASLIPLKRTYMRPTVDADKWVTGLKITAYSFREGTQEEWETDDNSYMFPTPWIATPQTVTLANSYAPEGTPPNVVEINGIYLINPSNVGEIAARLAQYWFNPMTVKADVVNNRLYRPGYLVQVYTGLDTVVSGYIQQESFAFGKQSKSTIKLIGVNNLPLHELAIKCMNGGYLIRTDTFNIPANASYNIELSRIDKLENDVLTIYFPEEDKITGVMGDTDIEIESQYIRILEMSKNDDTIWFVVYYKNSFSLGSGLPYMVSANLTGPTLDGQDRFHISNLGSAYWQYPFGSTSDDTAAYFDWMYDYNVPLLTVHIKKLTPGVYYFWVYDIYRNQSDIEHMEDLGVTATVYRNAAAISIAECDGNKVNPGTGLIYPYWNIWEIEIDSDRKVKIEKINSYTVDPIE